jgi:hypothetical protein
LPDFDGQPGLITGESVTEPLHLATLAEHLSLQGKQRWLVQHVRRHVIVTD